MKNGPRFPISLGLCILLGIAAFFLWEEHRAHLLGALPYLLLLLCPLMHFLMHGKHGSHSDSDSRDGRHQ